jgi:3-oxoacyl-[acyl-carrier-protein] synthase III
MRWRNVHIEGIGHDLPAEVLTSDAIEEMLSGTMDRLKIPRGRLAGLTGIHERRMYANEEQPSDIATRAAKRALEKAGIRPEDLDLIINCSIIRDFDEPGTASFVGGNLGVPHRCDCFDISHACLGFVTGLVQASNAIELGQARYALVVTGENFAPGIRNTLEIMGSADCDQRTFFANFATLTLGNCGVAFVLSHKDVSRTSHRVLSGVAMSATEHNRLCVANRLQMTADPVGLKVHGLNLVDETWPHFLEASGWDKDDIEHFICHQVGVRHITEALERMGVEVPRGFLTASYLGNCGSAAVPVTMAEALEAGVVKQGEKICFNGVGSGLGTIMLGVEW